MIITIMIIIIIIIIIMVIIITVIIIMIIRSPAVPLLRWKDNPPRDLSCVRLPIILLIFNSELSQL